MRTMKLQQIRPMLWTAKLTETIAFYSDIMGFTLSEKNDEWGWARLMKDEVEIMLVYPNENAIIDDSKFTGSFYFDTNDVESLWNSIKDKVSICYELDTFDWGMKEFAIYDNNGYILQFGQQAISSAV